MKRVFAALVVLVTLLTLALGYKIRAQEEAQRGPAGGSGVVEGTTVDLASRLGARIERLHVRRGASVHAGDVLAELTCDDPRAQLAQVDAQIAAATAQAEAARAQIDVAARTRGAASAAAGAADARVRVVEAHETTATREASRVASLGEYAPTQRRDQAEDAVVSVQREIEAARAQSRASRAQASIAIAQRSAAEAQADAAARSIEALAAQRSVVQRLVDECTVRAPRDGVVEEVYYEAGELVAPGAAIVRLVDLSEVTATFYLPNAELGAIALGSRARVVADAWPGVSFDGEVITIAPEAEFTPRTIQTRTDRDRLVYPIEVRVANPDHRLRPGMPVQVTMSEDGAAHASAGGAQ